MPGSTGPHPHSGSPALCSPYCSKSLGKAWVPDKILNKLTSRGRSDSQSIFEKVAGCPVTLPRIRVVGMLPCCAGVPAAGLYSHLLLLLVSTQASLSRVGMRAC